MSRLRERLMAKVVVDGDCWLWTGAITRNGYGLMRVPADGEPITMSTPCVGAHRVSYLVHRGDCLDGMHLHHECKNRACVNPDHLTPMSPGDHARHEMALGTLTAIENKRATTHCPRGHAYDESNTYMHDGKRHCRTCHREKMRAAGEAKKVYRDLVCPECRTEFRTSDGRKVYCCRGCKVKASNRRTHARRRPERERANALKCHAQVSDLCYHGWPYADWREDGTYRESTDTVVCDACYVAVMEASPSGMGLMREIDGTLRLLRERRAA